MRTIPNVQNGDTIGVAVQQSDLPMIQFLLNGEPLHELAISRFRGGVYPSVFVREGYNVQFVWDEDDFDYIFVVLKGEILTGPRCLTTVCNLLIP